MKYFSVFLKKILGIVDIELFHRIEQVVPYIKYLRLLNQLYIKYPIYKYPI